MRSSTTLRTQIEAALADRIPSALTPAAKTIREVVSTGIAAIDTMLDGRLPVGGVTEMIGAECSGRTALALSFLAQLTKAERVCAWIDVSNALSPESAAASGIDLSGPVELRRAARTCLHARSHRCSVGQGRLRRSRHHQGRPARPGDDGCLERLHRTDTSALWRVRRPRSTAGG